MISSRCCATTVYRATHVKFAASDVMHRRAPLVLMPNHVVPSETPQVKRDAGADERVARTYLRLTIAEGHVAIHRYAVRKSTRPLTVQNSDFTFVFTARVGVSIGEFRRGTRDVPVDRSSLGYPVTPRAYLEPHHPSSSAETATSAGSTPGSRTLASVEAPP